MFLKECIREHVGNTHMLYLCMLTCVIKHTDRIFILEVIKFKFQKIGMHDL